MEPKLDMVWVTKNQRLDLSGTYTKTIYYWSKTQKQNKENVAIK